MRADDMLQTRGVLRDGVALLHLAGELDMATAPLVDHAAARLMAQGPRQLDVDVAAVTFCDIAGLRALLRSRRAAHAHHAAFRLVGVHHRLRRLLTLLHAADLLTPAPA